MRRSDVREHPLLSLVPPKDQELVRAKAAALSGDPGPSVHGGQLYDRRAVALTVAAMAPTLSVDKLSLLLRYCMWTVALDARLDAPGTSLADVQRTADSVVATVEGDNIHEPELAQLLTDLRCHDPGGRLVSRFTDALCDAVAAGVEHAALSRRVAAGTAMPPVEDYLDLASRDVNYRSVAWALLVLVGAGATGRAAAARLDEATWHACRAVRLANDLRTAAKDLRDKRLNILVLRTRDGRPVTSRDVERWLDQHIHTHSDLLVQASARGLREQSRALENGVRMAVGLYRLAGSD
jgi:hypothetical protein